MGIKAFVSDILLRANMFVRPIKTRSLDDYDVLPDKSTGGILELEDCLVMPGAVGIHHGNGHPIVESFLQRGGSDTPSFPHGKPTIVEINPFEPVEQLEKAIVLPRLGYRHYGQLVTETAGWLSELLNPQTKLLELVKSGTPVVMLGKGEYVKDSALGLIKFLDIEPDRIVLANDLSRPIRCKKVLLPQPTMVGYRAMDKKQLQAVFLFMNRWYGIDPDELHKRMQTVTAGDGMPGDKIYLSRSKLPDNLRKIIDEERLEKELSRCGWKIVHPETLSIQDQILALHHARVIGGNLGSGFHTLLYLGDEAKGKIVIGLGTDNIENERYGLIFNFIHQFRLQEIRFWHLSCLGFEESTSGQKIYRLLRYYDLKLLYSTKRIVRRMEAIANHALSTTPAVNT